MSDYWFFMSYARTDAKGGDPYVKKFYQDLVEEVRNLAGLPSNLEEKEIGYFDIESNEPGENWPALLQEALQTNRIFVCLYSPGYFNSEYCGKEFQVFISRLRTYEQKAGRTENRPRVIMPVLWVPVEDADLPVGVRDIQYTHKDFGKVYAEEGLRFICSLKKYEDRYRQFLREFAKRLVDTAKKCSLPSLPDFPAFKQIVSAFQKPHKPLVNDAPIPTKKGPKTAQFIFVAGSPDELMAVRRDTTPYGDEGGRDWCPYHTVVKKAIGIYAQEIATIENFYYEMLPLDASLINQLQAAERTNNIVVIVVDRWTIRLKKYHDFMLEYDRRNFLNCALLIPLNESDDETAHHRQKLDDAVKLTFRIKASSKDPNYFRDAINSPEQLIRELKDTLTTVQMRIINTAEVARRVETENIIVKPTLAVPGWN